MSATCAISAHDLTVGYDRRPVLWNLNLELPEGQLIGVIGPNGSGKTTLLKSLLGLLPLASGEVRFWGQPLAAVQAQVSYVPQRSSVDWDFPATVLDVALMGRYPVRRWWARPSATDRALAKAALEQVGMLALRHRQIGQLSGGQRQRVFLARALAQAPELYLLDEPFAGVDIATEQTIVGILKELRAAGKTVVVVHHDLKTAAAYFDWAVLLNQRVVANGPAEQVLTDELLQRTYSGQLNLLTAVADALHQQELPARDPYPTPPTRG
ncbi:MAG: metal ABC transporter ATP-binding protein [Bacteroidia bacterium]|nr:metal ABC transporter ATP-binding protein [Bacteroidia bacterium]